MGTYGTLLLVLAVGASAALQICTDSRITRNFLLRSVVVLAAYLCHAAIGGFVIFFLVPSGPSAALGATVALLGWVGFGILGLIRFVPCLRAPPAALLRFGLADAICLLMIGYGIGVAVGLLA